MYTWACLVPKDIDFASAKRKQNQRRRSSTSVRRAVWQFLPLYLPNPNCVIAPSAIPPFIDPLMDSSLSIGNSEVEWFQCRLPSLLAAIEGRIPRESGPTAVSPSLKSTLDRLRNFTRRAAPNIE